MHQSIRFLPMGPQATGAGLIQLCAELHRSGLLNDDAIERIKNAIIHELTDRAPRSVTKLAFRSDIHDRLDKVLSGCEQVGCISTEFSAEAFRSNS